jgi:hypothetical protein
MFPSATQKSALILKVIPKPKYSWAKYVSYKFFEFRGSPSHLFIQAVRSHPDLRKWNTSEDILPTFLHHQLFPIAHIFSMTCSI